MNADLMAQPWVCADCRAHFPLGQMVTCRNCPCVLCPWCRSHRVARADGIVLYADAALPYGGEIGPVQ